MPAAGKPVAQGLVGILGPKTKALAAAISASSRYFRLRRGKGRAFSTTVRMRPVHSSSERNRAMPFLRFLRDRAFASSVLLASACMLAASAAKADPLNLQLAYQATFPNGFPQASVDFLRAGPMQPGDTLIPNTNPTFARLPGELFISITRPIGLLPDFIPAATAWATPVNFGAGSVSRISATFRAPVGPLATGGFAIGLVAKTGGKNDLPSEPRIAVTVNVRPGALVRLNVPFGSTQPTAMVLPVAVRNEIFSAVAPKPFTIDLSIDRTTGTGRAELTVGNNVFSLPFVLADFQANGGPAITAMGAGIAVNSNGPGQTASVHLRDFRIYTYVSH
jgi:hypothetical protein